MSYSIAKGESVHALTGEEWGMYEDLGWTMTSEPGTTCLAGLAVLPAEPLLVETHAISGG